MGTMASPLKAYKKMKTIDKVLIPAILFTVLGMAAFFSKDLNAATVVGAFLACYIFVHFALTKTHSTIVLIIVALQLVIFMPVSYLYGYVAASQLPLNAAFNLGAIYVFAGSYLVAWSTWKWSSGRWSVKLFLGYLAFDILAPLGAFVFPTPTFIVTIALGAVFVALVCIPWSRVKSNPGNDVPQEVKSQKATDALMELAKAVEGTTVQKSHSDSTDFTVQKGKKTFHVTVLGLNHSVKMNGGIIQYGPHNLKPVLYQASVEAKKRKHIPIVVNYADSSMTFLEINASMKKEERRSRHVIVTTPPRLVEILRNA